MDGSADKVQIKRKDGERQAWLMLESVPMLCVIWNAEGLMQDCNTETLRLLKLKSKDEYIDRFFDFSPIYQPDGELSRSKAQKLFGKALKRGRIIFEWEYLTADGKRIPTETTVICVNLQDGRRLISCSRDLSETQDAKKREREAERRLGIILDTIPMAAFLVSRDYRLVDCNTEAVRMLHAEGKNHLINSFFDDFSPVHQLDNSQSKSKAAAEIDKAYSEGYALFEWTHKMHGGELIPTEITLLRVPWNNDEELLCAYARDLRQIKSMEAELLRKSRMLETVNGIAMRLMPNSASEMDGYLQKSMEILARSVLADKVNLWVNSERDGSKYYRLLQSWPAETQDEAWRLKSYDGLRYWKRMIFRNRVLNGPVDKLPQEERAILSGKGIKSILAIPIVIWNKIWGFISFHDLQSVRYFTDSEEHVLRSSSTLLAAAIHRHSMTQQLVDTNDVLLKQRNMLTAVNKVAVMILASEKKDFPLVIQKALKVLGESVGADRASVWKIFTAEDKSIKSVMLTRWKMGKTFAEAEHGIVINLFEYVPQWRDGMEKPSIIEQEYKEMNDSLKSLNILNGIESLLVIPLILQDGFWGYVGFSHNKPWHKFQEEEKSILHSGSMMIAESIIRNEITDSLQKVEEVAATDMLTGLMNRSSFIPGAEALFSSGKHEKKPCALLFLDIDHFKNVNDNYGHDFGDEVLVRFSDTLRRSIRPSDLCCRYGGEEFVIMLAQSTEETAVLVAERIMDSIKKIRFEYSPEFRFTTSIGLVSGVPDDHSILQDYIKKADSCLYKAKNEGRNRIVVYEE